MGVIMHNFKKLAHLEEWEIDGGRVARPGEAGGWSTTRGLEKERGPKPP